MFKLNQRKFKKMRMKMNQKIYQVKTIKVISKKHYPDQMRKRKKKRMRNHQTSGLFVLSRRKRLNNWKIWTKLIEKKRLDVGRTFVSTHLGLISVTLVERLLMVIMRPTTNNRMKAVIALRQNPVASRRAAVGATVEVITGVMADVVRILLV